MLLSVQLGPADNTWLHLRHNESWYIGKHSIITWCYKMIEYLTNHLIKINVWMKTNEFMDITNQA